MSVITSVKLLQKVKEHCCKYHENRFNFTIVYDHQRKTFDVIPCGSIQYATGLYFEDQKRAYNFIQEIGEDNLIEILFKQEECSQ